MSDALKGDKLVDAITAKLTAPGEQFELTQVEVRGATYTAFKNAPPSMAGYLMLAMQHQDLDFLVYEGERYSYGQGYRYAQALGAYLQEEHGIGRGDRVAIAMRNYPEWCFSYMASLIIGAVAVPLNAWWQAEELGYALADSGAKLVIADEARAERIVTLPRAKRPPILVVRPPAILPDGMTALESDIFESGKMATQVAIDPEDDATILYTSGSTGYPKGAVSTHRALVGALMNYACYGLTMLAYDATVAGEPVPEPGQGPQQGALLAVPLFHVTGANPVFLVSFLIGRKIAMMHKWDATEALRLIEKEKLTYFVGVPTMSLELLQHPRRDEFDLSSLVDLGAGGAARPAEHVARLKEAFPGQRPGIGYGLTETNGVGAINSREKYLEKPASTGRATKPLVEIAIFDDAGNRRPTGEVGEVWLKSVANARGYWNKPEATGESFTADGWFKTGDLGYLDADGYLFIVDRKKDIIIRGGENISCLEVEAALYDHKGVAEASVFGLPDERLGESVAAVVYPKPGEKLDEDELADHVSAHLAAFKVPARIWIVGEPLPKLGSGKIDKPSLRAHYREKAKAG